MYLKTKQIDMRHERDDLKSNEDDSSLKPQKKQGSGRNRKTINMWVVAVPIFVIVVITLILLVSNGK